MIFDRDANLKYKYGNRHNWWREYYEDTAGRDKKAIEEYVKSLARIYWGIEKQFQGKS